MRFLKCTRMLLSMQGVDIPLRALVTGFNLTSGTGEKVYPCPQIGRDKCCTFKQAYDERIYSQLTYGAVRGRVFPAGCASHWNVSRSLKIKIPVLRMSPRSQPTATRKQGLLSHTVCMFRAGAVGSIYLMQ